MIMKDKYFFLSNFYPCLVHINIEGKEILFQNAEAAFQAQKNAELAPHFALLQAWEAKKLGKGIAITTPNWNTYRLTAMAKALHSKFSDPKLMEMLQDVNEEIVEDNYWNDTYWGVCKGNGKNMLGKMLTNIKENNNDFDTLMSYIHDVLENE